MKNEIEIIKIILEKLGHMTNNDVIGYGAAQPVYVKSTREMLGDSEHAPEEKDSKLPDIENPVAISKAFLERD